MKSKRENRQEQFDDRIGYKGLRQGVAAARCKPGAGRHTAEEQRQYQRLRVGLGTEKRLQIPCPERFVRQPTKPEMPKAA